MSKSKKPKHWYNVVPTGTPHGDEEHKFFVALARNKKYSWRSVAALATETGLTEARIEEIIDKYEQMGLVFQNPTNENNWGYWERNPEMVAGEVTTLAGDDQKDRIDNALSPDKIMKWGMTDPTKTNDVCAAVTTVHFEQACKILETAMDKQLVSDFMNLNIGCSSIPMNDSNHEKLSADCWSIPMSELNNVETVLGGHAILNVGYDPQMTLPFPPLMPNFEGYFAGSID